MNWRLRYLKLFLKNMEGMAGIHRADVMERKTQRNAKGGNSMVKATIRASF